MLSRIATLFGREIVKQIGIQPKTMPQIIVKRFISETSISERVLFAVQLVSPENSETIGEKLTLDSHFIDNLGLNTRDHIQIIESLEEEFQIEISDFDAKDLMRPKDIVHFINQKEEVRNNFMADNCHKTAFINLNY